MGDPADDGVAYEDGGSEAPIYTAPAYKVWMIDCPCGMAITYDEDSHPDHCEECGAEVEVSEMSG